MWILSEAVAALWKLMQIFARPPLCGVIALKLWGRGGLTAVETHRLTHTSTHGIGTAVTPRHLLTSRLPKWCEGVLTVTWSTRRRLAQTRARVHARRYRIQSNRQQGCLFRHEACVLARILSQQKCKHSRVVYLGFAPTLLHTYTHAGKLVIASHSLVNFHKLFNSLK